MRAIPKTAMPVVEVLRREVIRPEEMPHLSFEGIPIWGSGNKECCAMGLRKGSSRFPVTADAFGADVPMDSVYEFFQWWDTLQVCDYREAVDAIWPPQAA